MPGLQNQLCRPAVLARGAKSWLSGPQVPHPHHSGSGWTISKTLRVPAEGLETVGEGDGATEVRKRDPILAQNRNSR